MLMVIGKIKKNNNDDNNQNYESDFDYTNYVTNVRNHRLIPVDRFWGIGILLCNRIL